MNTHDIELPPLPPLRIVPNVEPVDYPDVAQALMDYARAAVEADRQRSDKALKAECERLAEALECMIIGACAVAVPHNGERAVLRDAVSIARKALATYRKPGGE